MLIEQEEPERAYEFDAQQAQYNLLWPPTISDIKEMQLLQEDFKYSEWHKEMTQKLCMTFSHYRAIRGDGNCGYRAVYVLYFELLISLGPSKIKAFIRNLKSDEGLMQWRPVFDIRHKFKVIEYLSKLLKEREKRQVTITHRSVLRMFYLMISSDRDFDLGLVMILRLMLANLLLEYPDFKLHGLPFSQVLDQQDYSSLNDYIERSILVQGEESQGLALYLLPIVLRIQIKTILMDRNAGNGGLIMETKAPYLDENYTKIDLKDKLNLHSYTIYLFLRPGHYDALYPSEFISQNQEMIQILIHAPKQVREFEDFRERRFRTFANVEPQRQRARTPDLRTRMREAFSEPFNDRVKLSCGCRVIRQQLALQLQEFRLHGKKLNLEGAHCYLRKNDLNQIKIRPLCLTCKAPLPFRDIRLIDVTVDPREFHHLQNQWNSLPYEEQSKLHKNTKSVDLIGEDGRVRNQPKSRQLREEQLATPKMTQRRPISQLQAHLERTKNRSQQQHRRLPPSQHVLKCKNMDEDKKILLQFLFTVASFFVIGLLLSFI